MARPTAAQRVMIARRAASAENRRARRIYDSKWTTEELCEQLETETQGYWKRGSMVAPAPWVDYRLYVCFQLAGHRNDWSQTKDPVHPDDAPPPPPPEPEYVPGELPWLSK